MRLIDADELMEHVCRDKLDSRALIAQMVNNAPTVDIVSFLREIKDQITKILITRDAIDKSVLLLEIRDSIIDKAIEIEGCSE